MNKEIYCGRGNHIPYAEYMALINLSFGFNTPETEFLGLLPKLYREEYRPQDQNYVVVEDGVLTTAVGAYDHELMVCGHRLPCRGVGNVAVHPDHRSKGYMRDAMNAALSFCSMSEDMTCAQLVINLKSFEGAVPCSVASVMSDSLRHYEL